MKKKKNLQKNRQSADLLAELCAYEDEGMQLFLNGKPCRKQEIYQACMLAENQGYMRDYISDEKQRICKINFVKIRLDS